MSIPTIYSQCQYFLRPGTASSRRSVVWGLGYPSLLIMQHTCAGYLIAVLVNASDALTCQVCRYETVENITHIWLIGGESHRGRTIVRCVSMRLRMGPMAASFCCFEKLCTEMHMSDRFDDGTVRQRVVFLILHVGIFRECVVVLLEGSIFFFNHVRHDSDLNFLRCYESDRPLIVGGDDMDIPPQGDGIR